MPKETVTGHAHAGVSTAEVAWSKTSTVDGGPFSGGPISLRLERDYGDGTSDDLVISLTQTQAAALAAVLRKAARTAVDSLDVAPPAIA